MGRVYVFKCSACGQYIEVDEQTKDSGDVRFTHAPGDVSRELEEGDPYACEGTFKRVWSLAGVSFSGPGFYSTDKDSR